MRTAGFAASTSAALREKVAGRNQREPEAQPEAPASTIAMSSKEECPATNDQKVGEKPICVR
jgi:hypothetical protein